MTEPLKVGIIGYGRQGKVHAEVWANMEGAKLVAIADPDPKRMAVAIREHAINGIKLFESGELELGRASLPLDLVIVATQPADHCRLTLAALKRGCHVICEKPMALALEEADEMVGSARGAKLLLAVHHQTVFTDAVVKAEKMVAAGEIGELYHMVGTGKGRPAAYDLMEIGGHLTHLMYVFAGDPSSVFGDAVVNGQAAASSDIRPIADFYPDGRDMGRGVGAGPGDLIIGHYSFVGGVRGTIIMTTLESESNEYMALELWGTRGRLRIHQTQAARLFISPAPLNDFQATAGGWHEVTGTWHPDPLWRVSMRRFAEDVLAAIRTGKQPGVDGDDGRTALEMCLGIYASHFAGRPLALPLKERKHLLG